MIQSFPPVMPESPRLLVLGSMPGVRSLQQQQYYAHPQNQFWRLMAAVLGHADQPIGYADRLSMLRTRGVALWDVLSHCEREGSLDSAIRDEVPNRIAALIEGAPTIKAIALNGRKAETSFKRHIGVITGVTALPLPSSSAANARMRFDQKSTVWCDTLQPWLR